MISCSDIVQVGTSIKSTIDACRGVRPEDIKSLVDLILAVNNCAGNGDMYNTRLTHSYQDPQVVTYPPGSFHALTFNVFQGVVNYEGFDLLAGSSRSFEFTTTNNESLSFILEPGAVVLVELIVKTV